MCGILGYVNGNIEKKADLDLTKTLIRNQIHRGPDDFGSFANENYAVSHLRLSIIDLSKNGRQPMQNSSGSISLVFNGELYNFKEMKEKYSLERKFKFKSKTDAEVVLYLYELLGVEFLNELNGMFALAIWDNCKKQLILARDRFGIKPLFYSMINNSLWFSSEIKSLLQVPGFSKVINLKAIYNYFSFDYIPGEETAFENIMEIKPGHFMLISTGSTLSTEQKRYWKPVFKNEIISDHGKIINEIRVLLSDAVRSQLISDVPVGVMLSGGMDSSALTALMANIRGDADFHSFSIGFDEPSFDESKHAEIVARHLGTTHHKILITPRTIENNFEKYISFIDEPYADGSAIPTLVLAAEAKNYVSVLLSGEGGDEVFAGYQTYSAFLFNKKFQKIPAFLRILIKKTIEQLPVSYSKLSFDFRAKKFLNNYNHSIPVCHYLWREVFSGYEKRQLFDPSVPVENFPSSDSLYAALYELNRFEDNLNNLLAIDCTYHLPDDLMVKNDRMTMASSVEARVPFTDNRLFEYMARISGVSKMRHNNSKYLLRSAMSPFLPSSILNKKKVGLEIPYSKWMCNELKELLLNYLSPDSLAGIPFLNRDYVQNIIKQHLKRKKDNGRELWGLLNFAAWYKLYF